MAKVQGPAEAGKGHVSVPWRMAAGRLAKTARAVACPACGAEEQRPCRDHNGRSTRAHRRRLDAWRAREAGQLAARAWDERVLREARKLSRGGGYHDGLCALRPEVIDVMAMVIAGFGQNNFRVQSGERVPPIDAQLGHDLAAFFRLLATRRP